MSFDQDEVSEARSGWQEALGITDAEWDRGEKRDPVFESCDANGKWFSIGPRLGSAEDSAFRFLMIMAAIAFGFSEPAEEPTEAGPGA